MHPAVGIRLAPHPYQSRCHRKAKRTSVAFLKGTTPLAPISTNVSGFMFRAEPQGDLYELEWHACPGSSTCTLPDDTHPPAS